MEIQQEDVKPFVFTFGSADPEAEREFEQLCDGAALKSGEIVTASGHRFWALLELDSLSSYEHGGTGIASVIGGKFRFAWHEDSEEYEQWLADMKRAYPDFQFIPYSYRYFDESVRDRDHHVGADGWSEH